MNAQKLPAGTPGLHSELEAKPEMSSFFGCMHQAAHRKALDVLNSLGLSDSLLRVIARRQRLDKWITYGGMVSHWLKMAPMHCLNGFCNVMLNVVTIIKHELHLHALCAASTMVRLTESS